MVLARSALEFRGRTSWVLLDWAGSGLGRPRAGALGMGDLGDLRDQVLWSQLLGDWGLFRVAKASLCQR